MRRSLLASEEFDVRRLVDVLVIPDSLEAAEGIAWTDGTEDYI